MLTTTPTNSLNHGETIENLWKKSTIIDNIHHTDVLIYDRTGLECMCNSGSTSSLSTSDDSSDEINNMAQIHKHKTIHLTPSSFPNGCICGHHIQYRDMVYETRKRRNSKIMGVTIRPKTPAISLTLRQ